MSKALVGVWGCTWGSYTISKGDSQAAVLELLRSSSLSLAGHQAGGHLWSVERRIRLLGAADSPISGPFAQALEEAHALALTVQGLGTCTHI